MLKFFIFLLLLINLTACTVKVATCDMVDAIGGYKIEYALYIDGLDTQTHFELTNWLTIQENSLKGLRINKSKPCPLIIQKVHKFINNKKYTLLYKRLDNLTFQIGFMVNNEDYWVSRSI